MRPDWSRRVRLNRVDAWMSGTAGATLRVYLETFEPDPGRHALAPLVTAQLTDCAEADLRIGLPANSPANLLPDWPFGPIIAMRSVPCRSRVFFAG